MNQSLRSLFCCIVPLLVTACASQPSLFPFELERSTGQADLPSRAQLIVEQRVDGPAELCRRYVDNLRFSARREGDRVDTVFTPSCSLKKDHLVLVSRPALPSGKYSFSINRTSLRHFEGQPKVYARFVNPDFNSGDNYIPEGAAPLEPNQSVKGALNYNTGNRSDWIRLNGKGVNVSLTLMTKADSESVTAGVFSFPETAHSPSLVGTLAPGRKRTFKIQANDLYLKVAAGEFKGPVEYSLLRRDMGSSSTKQTPLAVLDAYQVGETGTVVLLQASGGLKAGDFIQVSGKRIEGTKVDLGRCEVASVDAGGATCRLDRPYTTDIVEYQAVGPLKGLAE